MSTPSCKAARVRAPWPLLALALVLHALPAQLRAQALPLEPEAEARIQRLADRVKEIIRNAGGMVAPTRPVPASRPPAPRPAPPKPAAAKPAASPTDAASVPATAMPNAPAVAAAPMASEPAVEVVLIQRKRLAISLFDFEESTSGFTLHTPSNWALLPERHITLTDQAQQGQQALAVGAPERAWLGVDLDEAVDFTELKAISYWLRADQTSPPPFAIKTGSQYDWCRLPVTAKDSVEQPSGRFVRYEADVRLAPQACRHVDLSDVRGFFWELAAKAPVVLDNVELR